MLQLASLKLVTLFKLLYICQSFCVHDQLSNQTQTHYYNDIDFGQRTLQQIKRENIRIFMDYTNLDSIKEVANLQSIKRMSNISASYFYHVIKVQRLSILKYPPNKSTLCGLLRVPTKYIMEGAIGDLGIIVGAETSSVGYVAKSTACAALQSNQRPIWGMMMWNDAFAPKDQFTFQQTLYVGIHQLTHILGFSAELFSKFPAGNPLITTKNGNFFKSPQMERQILNFFGCSNSTGLPLEDQDFDLISSHWQRKVLGNQFMIAQNKKGAYVSRFTLALLESTGWYQIDYSLAEKSVWGQNEGCSFLDIDNCAAKPFCNFNKLACDWDRSAFGFCTVDKYSGACKQINYYTNTICVKQSYISSTDTSKQANNNPNSVTNDITFEQSGYNSRCFESTFTKSSVIDAPKYNFRCYKQICSFSGNYLFIKITVISDGYSKDYIIVCQRPGQIKTAPFYMKGTLTCPDDFLVSCKESNYCPFHCNKKGVCLDGKCLCIGSKTLSSACLDQYTVVIGSTGGYSNSKRNNQKLYIPSHAIKSTRNSNSLGQQPSNSLNNNSQSQLVFAQKSSINTPCISGSFLDPIFKVCISCQQEFGCSYCSQNGCITCDDGKPSYQGSCISQKR